MKKSQDTNKSEKRKLDFEFAYNVVKFLAWLPKSIKDIFTPKTEDELLTLEMNITRFISREREREKVITLQREFNLPLRPNQSLREVLIRIKILILQKKLRTSQEKTWQDSDKDKNC